LFQDLFYQTNNSISFVTWNWDSLLANLEDLLSLLETDSNQLRSFYDLWAQKAENSELSFFYPPHLTRNGYEGEGPYLEILIHINRELFTQFMDQDFVWSEQLRLPDYSDGDVYDNNPQAGPDYELFINDFKILFKLDEELRPINEEIQSLFNNSTRLIVVLSQEFSTLLPSLEDRAVALAGMNLGQAVFEHQLLFASFEPYFLTINSENLQKKSNLLDSGIPWRLIFYNNKE
jgi:hypothetical protein